jgi:hypothetical protein
MKGSTTRLVPGRRLAVRRSGVAEEANGLAVDCPLVKAEVLLQRCAFCRHGEGLLLNSSTNRMTLRCTFAEWERAEALHPSPPAPRVDREASE